MKVENIEPKIIGSEENPGPLTNVLVEVSPNAQDEEIVEILVKPFEPIPFILKPSQIDTDMVNITSNIYQLINKSKQPLTIY